MWVGGTLANVRSDEPEQGLKRLGGLSVTILPVRGTVLAPIQT